MNAAFSPTSPSISPSPTILTTPAFKALHERYTAQRQIYNHSHFAQQIEPLFTRHPFSSSLPKINNIVVLGLGTLTRVPNTLWDPENATFQFLLLEHIVARSRPSVNIVIQDPAFTPLDAVLIQQRIPRATVLNGLISHGADPAASLISSATLLFMPFVDVEIVAECLGRGQMPIVICADIKHLLERVDNEYAQTRRKAALKCIDVFEEFLGRYRGEPLPPFAEKEDAFQGLRVYRKKSTAKSARRKEDMSAATGCMVM